MSSKKTEHGKAHQQNRKAWNEAAVAYERGIQAWVDRLKAGEANFVSVEREFLDPLMKNCDLAVHLQCAGGTDSLSLLNIGATKVIGVDISDEMIEVAREKTERLGANAEWLQSDVLELPAKLEGVADLVYTGRGALYWLMDISAWGRSVAKTLKSGGHAYVFEGHPYAFFFDMSSEDRLELDKEFTGYFSDKLYESRDWPETYVGKLRDRVEDQELKYERLWTMSDFITALIEAGLVIKAFKEHPDPYWGEFPKLNDDERAKIPNTFSILAQKP